ncbi:MAG TPA: cupin domain-containing protein [Acidimicrobiales bacterium]
MSADVGTSASIDAEWTFLGVRIRQLTAPGAPIVVAEAHLPAGASPPLHVHADLDDSFYVIEGTMVVRCGEEVSIANTGDFVPFPSGVPHTFRVIDRPARVLTVHTNDSFMRAVRAIGTQARGSEPLATHAGPAPDRLAQMLAEHGICVVGAAMEEDEGRKWVRWLG